MKYQICPSYCWLWKYKNGIVPPETQKEIAEQRKEQGEEVELYARKLFPEGVLVEDYQSAQRETERLINEGVKTLFQATAITNSGLLAKADVLQRDGDTDRWHLYEVKSVTSLERSEHKKHINDATFQKIVFEEAGYNISTVSIIHLNKNYVKQGDLKLDELFIKENIDERVAEIIDTIRQQANEAVHCLQQSEEPTDCDCRLKTKRNHCITFSHFHSDMPKYPVFNLAGIRQQKLASLIDNKIYQIQHIPDDMELTPAQRNQVAVTKTQRPKIDKIAIAELLDGLEYPLYFLDYETCSMALPELDGCHPYQQIPFQYSLHILSAPDGELVHHEHLGDNYDKELIPNLVQRMRQQIGSSGSIIVWYKFFETQRNTEMAQLYPEHADFFNNINSRIFDLMDIFKKQHYVHPNFHGSNSIKDVLPVLVPKCDYKNLAIQEGLMASVRWHATVVGTMTKEAIEQTRKELLEYCELDTRAMVKIYEHLKAHCE